MQLEPRKRSFLQPFCQAVRLDLLHRLAQFHKLCVKFTLFLPKARKASVYLIYEIDRVCQRNFRSRCGIRRKQLRVNARGSKKILIRILLHIGHKVLILPERCQSVLQMYLILGKVFIDHPVNIRLRTRETDEFHFRYHIFPSGLYTALIYLKASSGSMP